MSAPDLPAPASPDASYVKQRWIPTRTVEWVKQCDEIMVAHGMVTSTTIYETRRRAQWRAQKLIRLMVELRLHERWQLIEHTERKQGGWIWAVEFHRRR